MDAACNPWSSQAPMGALSTHGCPLHACAFYSTCGCPCACLCSLQHPWVPPAPPKVLPSTHGCPLTLPPNRTTPLPSSPPPRRYSLTPQGQILAQRLAAAALETPPPEATPPEVPPHETTPPEAPPPPDFELLPGHFDIVLCVDIAEESGYPAPPPPPRPRPPPHGPAPAPSRDPVPPQGGAEAGPGADAAAEPPAPAAAAPAGGRLPLGGPREGPAPRWVGPGVWGRGLHLATPPLGVGAEVGGA